MVKVSVLMTAFNRESYIAESIESVLGSSFRDFELIIVDDCSSDSTVEIARHYELTDNRVKVYVNDQNIGDYPNRNKAASYAQGYYLKYLDSDDTMAKNCLERMVSEMDRFPNCAFGVTSRKLMSIAIHNPEDAYRVHFFVRGLLDLGPSHTIIRRDIFILENGFGEERCVSDFEFWLRLALKYSILEVEANLIFWREHSQQEMSFNSHIEQTLMYIIPIIKDKLALCLLKDSEKRYILKKYKKGTMRYLLKNIRRLGVVRFFYFKQLNRLKLLDAF
jgi:glycosyltransferase involved in cell wall biosynthesis